VYSGVEFVDNKADDDGGVFYFQSDSAGSGTIDIQGSVGFRGNRAGKSGGVFYLVKVPIAIRGSVFFGGNRAGKSGGVFYLKDVPSGSVEGGVRFHQNYGNQEGGVAVVRNSVFRISDADFDDNSASYKFVLTMRGRGGSLFVTSSSAVSISHSTFRGSTAGYAGAIYAENSTLNITDNVHFTECIAIVGGEAGKYIASIGALTCTYCEKDKYSGVGATTCVDGLPPTDIEDELMQAAKMYPTCNCTRSWREILQSKPNTHTGGLGELMVPDKYEVWMCLQDNMCSTPADWFCYVFNEQTLKFEAWGFNSDVKVVKIVHRELPLAS
jgi:hypothetical protein